MAEPCSELAAILKRQSLKFQEAESPPIIESAQKTSPSASENGQTNDGSPPKIQDAAGYQSQKAPETGNSSSRKTMAFGTKRPQIAGPAPDWEVVMTKLATLAQDLGDKSDPGSIATKLLEDLRALRDAATSSVERQKQQDAEIAKLRGQVSAVRVSDGSTQEVKDLCAEIERKNAQIEASAGSMKENQKLRTELEKVEKALATQERENQVLRRDLTLARNLQEQAQEERDREREQIKTITESRDRAREEHKAARREVTHHHVTQIREAEAAACREADELRARLVEAQQEEAASQAVFELQCELAEAKGAKEAHEEMANFATSACSEEVATLEDSELPSEASGKEAQVQAPLEVSRAVSQLEDEFAFIKKQADRLEEEQKKRREDVTKLLAED